MTSAAPEGWYPDPARRHELRFWNGAVWTEHVVDRGVQTVDPLTLRSAPIQVPVKKAAARDARRAGVAVDPHAGGTLLEASVLVIHQKPKIIEVNAEYAIHDQNGRRIGAVREVGQNLMKKAVGLDEHTTRRLLVVDHTGQTLFSITKPVTLLRAQVIVRDSAGAEVGQLRQRSLGLLKAVDFRIERQGTELASVTGEDFRAWNFGVQDTTGTEIGRIGKSWAGLRTETFTKRDNYVVEIGAGVALDMRVLIIASAVAIDTAFHQNVPRRRIT